MAPHVRRALLWTIALGVASLGLLMQVSCGPSGGANGRDTLARPPTFRVLVFTKHQGYYHESIPAAVAAVRTLGAHQGFAVLATEDAGFFSDDRLRPFAAVAFLSTTGDVLSDEQKAAFQRYIRAGGGFVGIHSAMDTEHGWAWYHRLLGADFAGHPAIQRARLIVSSANQTPPLPQPWERTDEWYNYTALPESVTVSVSVDEGSYQGGTMGASHPVSWYHEFEGGRAWYTAMGHTTSSYSEELFLAHILGGILYAAGVDQPKRSS